MRCNQWIGLKPEAEQFLQDMFGMRKYTLIKLYEDGTKDYGKESEEPDANISVDDHWIGMFDEEYPLLEYKKGDTCFREVVQSDQWYSGPVVFTALKDGNGDLVQESMWTEKEMAEYR
jgi:hypothetical protein